MYVTIYCKYQLQQDELERLVSPLSSKGIETTQHSNGRYLSKINNDTNLLNLRIKISNEFEKIHIKWKNYLLYDLKQDYHIFI